MPKFWAEAATLLRPGGTVALFAIGGFFIRSSTLLSHLLFLRRDLPIFSTSFY